MDQLVSFYKFGRYSECCQLLNNKIKSQLSLKQNFQIQICLKVCNSLLCIAQNRRNKIDTISEELLILYNNIKACGEFNETIPEEIELVAFLNYLWWFLNFPGDIETNDSYRQEILNVIDEWFMRVFSKNSIHMQSQVETEYIICEKIKLVKDILFTQRYKTCLLMLEIILLIFLILIKMRKDDTIINYILVILQLILKNGEMHLNAVKFHDAIEEEFILKFCLLQTNSTLTELNSQMIFDQLTALAAVILFLRKEYSQSLTMVKSYPQGHLKSLWLYMGAINCFMLEKYDESLSFLLMPLDQIMNYKMMSNVDILFGRIYARNKDYMQALKYFKKAQERNMCNPMTLYYIGQQYRAMGLYAMMVKSCEDILRVLGTNLETTIVQSFEEIVLLWMHPDQAMFESEALYILAIAYGIDQSFQKAVDIFEKVLQQSSLASLMTSSNEIITIPPLSTLYHEAAVMNLLSVNLTRCEQLCMEAIDSFAPDQFNMPKNNICINKDVTWIQNLLDTELGMNEISKEQDKAADNKFYEQDLRVFEEDIIGLMILAQVHKLQSEEEYKSTLMKLMSLFSKYMLTQQKSIERSALLTKALAGKCCLNIAEYQVSSKSATEVEKMFKRALSCNHGDKDVLFKYASFLQQQNRSHEASKLLKTFSNKESSVTSEQCDSLALQYLLTQQVSQSQLEKLFQDVVEM